MSNDLQIRVDKLSNQARFVQMIVEKELVVSNRKKADVIAELRKKAFKPMPKIVKKKGVYATEDVVEEDEEDKEIQGDNITGANPTDFDYLLGMAISSLTQEKALIFPLHHHN